MRNTVDINLCDILQGGSMAYFIEECMTNTMLRIRGMKGMGRYKNLIDGQSTERKILKRIEKTTASI